MRKMILTAAAALTALTVMTGCQAKPAGDTNQTTAQESAAPETTVAVEVDLEEVHAAVKEAYGENYIPSMAFDGQAMNDLFGIGSELYDSFIAEGPMISVHVDQFVAVKAKEGKGAEVETRLTAYRDSQLNDAMQYPMNQPKVEASEVLRHGDYVFFVMLGTPSDEALDQGEEAALESAKEQNKIALDIIDGYFS